ncbi:MAG: Cadherin, partial [Alphaproteobacteria bacterium]|nr:Cadherin [Alphaproteobacteria bacterium]
AITDAEQTLVDQKVRTRAYLDTAANFNKSATGGVKFEDLPEEAKTVLVDLWFQYPHPATSIPKFWGHATSGRWRDAQRELNNFGDHYGPRRSEEAEHLNSAIQNGKLK